MDELEKFYSKFKDNPLRWKYGYASYHHHTPLDYEIVEKGECGDWEHPGSYVKIRPLTIGISKSTCHTLIFRESETQQIHLCDYTFWIPRRMIRRGPNSWSIKKNRWIHEKTFNRCLGRAYRGKEEYRSSEWDW